MSIENEPLKLLPHQLIADPNGRWVVTRPDGSQFEIPVMFQELFQLTRQGATLSHLATRLRKYEMGGRFALLAAYVCFLYDRDLLADRRALQLAESLRSDHVWRSSIASEEWSSVELAHWARPKEAMRSAFPAIAIFLIGANSFIIWMTHLRVSVAGAEMLMGVSPLSTLLAFVIVLCVGRSLHGFGTWFIERHLAGAPSRLRLVLDSISLRLAGEEFSKVRANEPRLFAYAGVFAWATIVSALISRMSVSIEFKVAASAATFLILLIELSPFSKTIATEWLRSYYNFADRKKENHKRTKGSKTEDRMADVQLLVSVVWILMLVGGMLFIYGPLVIHFFKAFDLSSPVAKLATLGLGALHVVIAVSIADEIANGFSLLGMTDRRRIRTTLAKKAS